jgi:hypothetical protein
MFGVIGAGWLGFAGLAAAQQEAPANNLDDLRRELGSCLARNAVGAGSSVTIMFTMKRDGSLLGRPRITHAQLADDAEARRRFLADVERAVDACLPVKITPSFGGAIAGRPFLITLGRPKSEGTI